MKRWMYISLLVLFAAIAAFAGYKLCSSLWGYKKGTDLYESIKETAISVKSSEANAAESSETRPRATAGTGEASEYILPGDYETEGKIIHLHAQLDYMIWPEYEVDFEALKDITEDVCGWIRIDDTHVDYPLVRHTDNDFYIRHGIDGEPLNTGSIFVDYRLDYPFEGDDNTVIYGHNQRNSSMFHDLLLYQEREFAENHPYVIIYLPDGSELTYRVFAAYLTPADSDTYSMAFSSDAAYLSYLTEMQSRSLVTFGGSLSAEDKIITLSTCTNEGNEYRMVVQAKLISKR